MSISHPHKHAAAERYVSEETVAIAKQINDGTDRKYLDTIRMSNPESNATK